MSSLTEVFIDEEREISYTCSATWEFLSSLENKHRNLVKIFDSLSTGQLNPTYIKDVISCSLIKIGTDDISDAKRESTAIDIIERFGVQESSILAREMLSRAMIGDIKKSQMDREMKSNSILNQMIRNSKSIPFWKHGLLWSTIILVSGIVGFLSSKLPIMLS